MNFRVAGIFGVALLLCGCSDADWHNALSYDTPSSADAAPVQTAGVNEPAPVDAASLPPPQADTPPAQDRSSEVVAAPQPSYSVTQTVTTETPVARVDPTTGYCRGVARSTGATATRDGMDGPAQQQAADVVLQKCLTFYGASGR